MFRFTIRDVLWLMVVVGLAIALWQERRVLLQERQNSELWSRRSIAALQVIQKDGTPADWYGSGIVVQETHESGANYTKVYPGTAK